MTVEHARALAMAYELQRLLIEVTDRAEDSAMDAALELVDKVVARLEPAEFEGSEPAPLVGIVRRRALHALASKRWRP